jgi:hypothetical protein
MIKARLDLLGLTLLIWTAPAIAQGTYTNGVRGGYSGSTASSPTSTNTPPGSTSNASSGSRNPSWTSPSGVNRLVGLG